jgi:acetyl esterase/lipase
VPVIDILSKPQPPPDEGVAYGADPNQFVEVRLPRVKGPYPALMNIHGGFWRAKYDLTHAGHLCEAVRGLGVATFNVEYRRVGNNGGGWPGTFSDIRSACRFVQQASGRFHLDANRLVVMGHSAGGQLALCLAAHETSVSRVISLAGVVDLKRAFALHLSNDAVVDFLGGKPDAVPEHYRDADPMELSIPHARQWLLHGREDDTVPPDFSRDYAKYKSTAVTDRGKDAPARKSETVELREIEQAGHFELIDPASEAFRHVTAAVLAAVA